MKMADEHDTSPMHDSDSDVQVPSHQCKTHTWMWMRKVKTGSPTHFWM